MTAREELQQKILEYEKNGWWERDINDDPETIVLQPNMVDYTAAKLSSKIMNKIGNFVAVQYYEGLIKKGQFVIKDIVGLDNLAAVAHSGKGVVMTCNHFSPLDNYAIYRPLRKLGRKRIYKVIREGNYTNFGGLYGFLFRHCNTLPLSSNYETMKNFFAACDQLLGRGEIILIFPEQSMWYNYRKPKPLKGGAFRIAVRVKVPVLPCFITMTDSTTAVDGDGYPVQEYTLHYLPPIYPDESLSDKQNVSDIAQKNYQLWKEVYESFYGIPLVYEGEQ